MSMKKSSHLFNSIHVPFRVLAMAMVLLALPAVSSAHEPAAGTPPASSSMPMHHAGMRDMKAHDGMSMTGDVDYDFAINMRKHHQMALMMAQAQMKNGKDSSMRTMASKIIVAQKKEIAELDRWIAVHDKAKAKQVGWAPGPPPVK